MEPENKVNSNKETQTAMRIVFLLGFRSVFSTGLEKG